MFKQNLEHVALLEQEAFSKMMARGTPIKPSLILRLLSPLGQYRAELLACEPWVQLGNDFVTVYILPNGRCISFQRSGIPALCFIVLLSFGVSVCCWVAFSAGWGAAIFILWLVMIALLLKTHFAGPGFVGFLNSTHEQPSNTIIELPSGTKIMCQSCRTCRISRPPRASHCRVCSTCVARFDHHCVVIGSCIGRDNMVYFFGFLFVVLLVVLMSFSVAIQVLDESRTNTAALVVITVDALLLIPMMWVVGYYVVSYAAFGVTYREWKRRGAMYVGFELEESWKVVPRPFHGGWMQNVKECFWPTQIVGIATRSTSSSHSYEVQGNSRTPDFTSPMPSASLPV